MKQITEIDDPRLVKGLAHPLRIAILRILESRVASPSEIAEELGAPLGNVSYHVRFLARVGLVELSGTRPRRGSVEHYYRAVDGVQVSAQAWAQVPQQVRDAMLGSKLHEIGRAVGAAAQRGGFGGEQAYATRTELTLDADGFSELSEAVAELHQRAAGIERSCAARIARRAGGRDGASGTGASGEGADGDGSPDAVRGELVLMLYGVSPDGTVA